MPTPAGKAAVRVLANKYGKKARLQKKKRKSSLKRPLTKYTLYCQKHRSEAQTELESQRDDDNDKKITSKHVNVLLGEWWRTKASEEEKAELALEADRLKSEYERKLAEEEALEQECDALLT